MKELPEKYYLTHFLEFTHFIKTTSSHLLSHEEKIFLESFDNLSEDARCTLVRVLNRKSAFIKKETLRYQEIFDSNTAINELRKTKFFARISKQSYQDFILELNKQELMDLSSHTELYKPTKSAAKAKWLNFVLNNLNGELSYQNMKKHPILSGYIVFEKQAVFQYLLFLYFGHLGGRLNQFSLRDLGVMNTQQVKQLHANFSILDQAKSAFLHANAFYQIKLLNKDDESSLLDFSKTYQELERPNGTYAEQKFHHGLYKLGTAINHIDEALSEDILSQSNHPAAQEKYIRILYKKGETNTCKTLLSNIINDPDSEALLLFAEDFYAQKFERKKTSILTDVLRQSPPPISVDEAYLGHVESGVKERYAREGKTCFFTENKLWRALFALTFWQELFIHPESERANEFSYFPKVLKENTFFNKFENHITKKLNEFGDANGLQQHIHKTLKAHQGEPNGLFFWHSQLEQVLNSFLENAPFKAVATHLLNMAKNFKELSDGYPDLMIIQDGAIHFEEIKAPGDSLRRNQLISIKHLVTSGFCVNIQRVKWQFNPNQTYVVVDIETTGGKKDNHRITEVGLVKIRDGKVIDTWQTLINPERHIPKMITELTGIDNEMVKNAPLFSQIADKLESFCQNAIFVAHNVNFDYGFIKQEFSRLEKRFVHAKICTVQHARKYLPGHQSYSLGKLCKDLGIALENHHRALDDAKAAAEILMKVNAVRKKLEASN